METIRAAAVSMNGFLGEPDRVFEAMESWCRQAVDAGAELVLFPELLIHGHCTPNTWEIAEPVPDGPSTKRACELARKHGLFLSVGLSEKEKDIVFNTQILVGPDGYIGKQRKIHLSRDEVLFYKGGREIPVFDIGKCKVGMIICYDNQFPELARILALKGADVLLMPHAARVKMWDDTPESITAARQATYDLFSSSYRMRARENACFAVLADQAGRAGYVENYPKDSPAQPHHAGAAFVIAPDGDILAEAQREMIRDEMIVHDLCADRLAAARRLPNYTLKTRRPELYEELIREQVSW
ncbi:MAG: nitrilase [Planctomycetaceae bacterium]